MPVRREVVFIGTIIVLCTAFLLPVVIVTLPVVIVTFPVVVVIVPLIASLTTLLNNQLVPNLIVVMTTIFRVLAMIITLRNIVESER